METLDLPPPRADNPEGQSNKTRRFTIHVKLRSNSFGAIDNEIKCTQSLSNLSDLARKYKLCSYLDIKPPNINHKPFLPLFAIMKILPTQHDKSFAKCLPRMKNLSNLTFSLVDCSRPSTKYLAS